MRAATVFLSVAALLAALAACGQEADPAASAADPTPPTRSAAPANVSTPTPAPPTPAPTPSPAPLPSAFTPGDRSDGAQGPYEAAGFSLATGFGERVALEDLLAEYEAVVVVFYRGFF